MFKFLVVFVLFQREVSTDALKISCVNLYICNVTNANTMVNTELNFHATAHYNTLKRMQTVIFVNATLPVFPTNLFINLPSLQNVTARDVGLRDIGSFGDRNTRKAEIVRTLILAKNKLTTLRTMAFIQLSRLTHLDVSFNQITDIESTAFNGITELNELILTGNLLKSFKDGSFSPLLALKKLHMDRNQLIELNLVEFSGIRNMLSVSAKQNEITTIGVEGDNRLINTLYLGYNQLEDIANLTKLSGLQTLHLNSNPILLEGDFFEKMPQLTNLVLDDTDLNKLEGNFTIFAPLQNVLLLSLSKNSLGSLELAKFPKLSKVTHLYLDDNNLTTLDFENLNTTFPKLQAIEITKNRFDCVFLKFMVEHFERIKVQLEFYEKGRSSSRFSVQGVECIHSGEKIKNLSSRLDTMMAIFSDIDRAVNQTTEYLESTISDLGQTLEKELQDVRAIAFQRLDNLESNYSIDCHDQLAAMGQRLKVLEDRAILEDQSVSAIILWVAVILSLGLSSLIATLYLFEQRGAKQAPNDKLQVAFSKRNSQYERPTEM